MSAASRAMALLLMAALPACQKAKSGPPERGPPEVGFVVVQAGAVDVPTELSGRVAALETSEVRPQVSGVVRARGFAEGSIVRQGQTLYQIDPSLYRAAANQAAAGVSAASATRAAARVRASRYRPLAQMQAISQQDYTDAVAAERQAAAQVNVNAAQLETARVNLRFTRVPAPITGRIGRSAVTVGALVTANQPAPLAVIQRLDEVFVDIQQSAAQLLALRRALAEGKATPSNAQARLTLEDGSEYGYTGRVEFAESIVDPNTGAVTLRARFPNPQGLLLPGMFVRARIVQRTQQNALLVPQQAVTRDGQGQASVLIVGANGRAQVRAVTVTQAVGANWVVTAGLSGGERVITQGLEKAEPGQPVRAVPAATPERAGAPAAKSGAPAAAKR